MQSTDIPTPKLVVILRRAYLSLAEFLDGGLALQGIINTDFMILEALLHKGPLAIPVIRQKIPLPEASIRLGIDRLKRRGLVRRKEVRHHQPADVIELTAEGHTTVTRIYNRHQNDIEAVMGILSSKEKSRLAETLKKIGMQGEKCQHARSNDRRGGLAPWQLRRATEYMTEHLATAVSLEELAQRTGLSASRFGRAFKISMAISPHKWQMNLRIAEAQELLKEGELPQIEIALATGFSEQSHFSRVFKDIVGMPPGVWQREYRP